MVELERVDHDVAIGSKANRARVNSTRRSGGPDLFRPKPARSASASSRAHRGSMARTCGASATSSTRMPCTAEADAGIGDAGVNTVAEH
jgi:hypothetical protein